MPIKTPELIKRFWSKVNKTDDCWTWTGFSDRDGYGCAKIKGIGNRAHRIAYVLSVGPIPPGKFVCHTCDNPSCVRPDHLWIGTALDNNRDRKAKGRKTGARGAANGMNTRPDRRWNRLHPELAEQFRGANSRRAKLTDQQAIDIRSQYHQKQLSVPQLAAKYGVCETTIYNIIKRRTMYE